MSFDVSTRFKLVPLPILTKPSGGGLTTLQLPRNALLSHIALSISVTISGTLSALNLLGISSAIRRVTVELNNGITIFDVSGPGFHYLVREMLGDGRDGLTYTDGRAAVVTGTHELDFIIPIALNQRDAIGLIMLQNERTLATLKVDWAADATVATGATITGTAKPTMYLFEVPSDPKDYPDVSYLHQILENQVAIPSTAEYRHDWQRGGAFVGMYQLLPSGFTRSQLVTQESNILEDFDVDQHRLRYVFSTGKDPALTGALTGFDKRIFYDFAGTDGLGQFFTQRDFINSLSLTSLFNRITPAAAQTMIAVHRWILPLAS